MRELVRRAERRLLLLLAGAAERLTLVRPPWGLRLAGALGRLAAGLPGGWRAPAEGELQDLLGPLAPGEERRLRRAIASHEFCNLALRRLIAHRGAAALEPLLAKVEAGPLLRLREAGTPVVVVGWHQGPQSAHVAALRRLAVPCLCATTQADLPAAQDGPVRHWRVDREATDAAFLKEALAQLERGGLVAMNVDWRLERGVPVSVLGHRMHVGPGAASLARIGGARLVPVTRRWCERTRGMEVAFHEALPEPAVPRTKVREFEAALLQAVAAWFDAWLRANPETLRVPRVRWLARAPRADGPALALPRAREGASPSVAPGGQRAG